MCMHPSWNPLLPPAPCPPPLILLAICNPFSWRQGRSTPRGGDRGQGRGLGVNYDLLKPQTSRTTTNKATHTHTCRGTITTPTRPITHSRMPPVLCSLFPRPFIPMSIVCWLCNIFTPFLSFRCGLFFFLSFFFSLPVCLSCLSTGLRATFSVPSL